VAVLREAELFKEWIPFCRDSSVVHAVRNNELIGHFNIYSPFLSRDGVFHAFGADCIQEHDGLVLLLVKSIDSFPGVQLPPLDKGRFGLHDRVDIKSLTALIRLSRENTAEV
jgi:hypothetical protein